MLKKMKKVLAITILLSLFSIVSFGALAMTHGNNQGQPFKGCFASAAQNMPCPISSPLAFSSFHIDALKKFSTAELSSLVMIVFLVILIGLTLVPQSKPLLLTALPVLLVEGINIGSTRKFQQQVLFWLSRRQNSPSFF